MNFEELRQAVFTKTPVFKEIIESRGNLSLYEHFENALHFEKDSGTRRKELLDTFYKQTKNILGENAAESARAQLEKNYYVSTADHHGPITHPFFSNSALLHSYIYRANHFENVIVLSCGGISLDNSSFPRGLFFHKQNLEIEKLFLLSRKNYFSPVAIHSPFTKENIATFKKDIEKTELEKKYKERILKEILPIYTDEGNFSFNSYSEQITKTNFELWKKIPSQENTNLIYLEQENLVSELLIKFHLTEKTIIHELLFNPVFQDAFEKYFENISGAFSETKGTFLFWEIQNGKRISLSREKLNALVHKKNGKNIEKLLREKKILPSMALTYIVLSFYYGLHCGGGFCQVNYLTDMKAVYKNMLTSLSNSNTITKEVFKKEMEIIETVDTKFFCGEFILATMGNDKETIHATPLDLFLYGNEKTGEILFEKSKKITLREATDAMMPEFYKILYGKEVEASMMKEYTPSIHDEATLHLLRE